MDQHNAEDKPDKKSPVEFSCDFFHADLYRTPKPVPPDDNPEITFESFEQWLDNELETLEQKFAHNATVVSLRNEFKQVR